MRFIKMQGIGNDYLYINAFTERVAEPETLARRLSDRHFGPGSDGIILIGPSDAADFRMTIYNADGSRARMCGNGIRCVGKYVYERGMTSKDVLTIETDAGIKTLTLSLSQGRVASVRVDMGVPELRCERIPCLLGTGSVIEAPMEVEGYALFVTPVGMGNPHAVVFTELPLERFPLSVVGPRIEHHPAFPERVNVEFVNVLSPERLRMRVWERGSGITLACGTGACAAMVAARLCGHVRDRAQLVLDGGSLMIEWAGEDTPVYMTGPAEFVYEGEID